MKRFQNLKKSHKIILGIILVIVILLLLGRIFGGNSNGNRETYTVVRGDVSETVVISGKTRSVQDIDLAFEKSGTIRSVYKRVGDAVYSGEVIAALDTSDLEADLLEAEAKLQLGTRGEDVQVAAVKVENARIAYQDAEAKLKNTLIEAVSDLDRAYGEYIDGFFNYPRSVNPTISISVRSQNRADTLEDMRVAFNYHFNKTREAVLRSGVNPTMYVSDILSLLTEGRVLIDEIGEEIERLSDIEASVLAEYKADIFAAQNLIVTAEGSVRTAQEAVNNALSSVRANESELTLTESDNNLQAIQAQAARVNSIRAQIEKAQIKSPIEGVLTKQDVTVGEYVQAGTIVAGIISESAFRVEGYIPEVYVGKISLGNKAHVELDAFPGESFTGIVTYIESSETLRDGVVNYRMYVDFDEVYPNMKSGLTSDATIAARSKNDVIVVPQRALYLKEGKTVIEVVGEDGKTPVDAEVKIGLRGDNGLVEIIDGVDVNDVIYVDSE